MTETDNKAMIRRFIDEGLNKLDAALIDEVYSVLWHWTLRAGHQGEILGIAPIGNRNV